MSRRGQANPGRPRHIAGERSDDDGSTLPGGGDTEGTNGTGSGRVNSDTGAFDSLSLKVVPSQPASSVYSVDIEAIFTKIVRVGSEKFPQTRDTSRFQLDSNLRGQTTLTDIVYPSTINVHVLGDDGVPRVVINQDITGAESDGGTITVTLQQTDIDKIVAKGSLPPSRPKRVTKACQFLEIILGKQQKPFEFRKARLLTAPLHLVGANEWRNLGFATFFGIADGPVSASKVFTEPLPQPVQALPWTNARVGVDGGFAAKFSVSTTRQVNAWAWLLTNDQPYGILGVVYPENEEENDSEVRTIILPSPPKDDNGSGNIPADGTGAKHGSSGCDCPASRIPTVVSEAELADNPGVYTEDPGSFCTPFKNPERILSEKSLYSVLRVEQPELSASASGVLRSPLLDFQLDPFVINRSDLRSVEGMTPAFTHSFAAPVWKNLVGVLDTGRHQMSARYPLQWEGDSLRYQATTVTKGHILEFRMRTRSNGYSLGGVAKTLTLAPRQTKRIQKIEWSRSERASRVEGTRLADTTNDTMIHDNSYQNAASASLDEWAQGSSRSSVTSAAAGGGMALGPVVIGGGVAHSSSNSYSQQSGGRDTSAAEEGQWRNAIRRHGDALRKFESTVVQEVTQTETVTGTTEVVRNINYAHSLTVIYHNILRHLRVDTEFAGARECLFVPFAIRPFTPDRALRWKESISRALRNRSFARALTYLKDVLSNFSNSSIPAGRRSEHPIRSLWGSLYLDLGVARPADKDDGKFDVTKWSTLLPYLPVPALAIFQQLATLQEAIKDQTFQRRYAPTIATKWCDNLEISARGQPLAADFTLASSYSFNGRVRVDFQISTGDSTTRELLSSFKVLAKKALPPGSKARVTTVTYNYETDFDKGSISLNRGSNDLIDAETGDIESLGANFDSVPNAYERRNVQQELRLAVVDLINHLNEYVEYYHKAIWWSMDRDRLFMLLDGFTVSKLRGLVSIANVVERDPIAVAGNCLVFRVSAGIFLGGTELGLEKPGDLFDYYNANKAVSEPMHISLPTDGLYAQTIMDECNALEEHFGNEDWALSDPDPDLGTLEASLLASRKAEPTDLKPTTLPSTIINLSNATPAPAPQGLSGVLAAVQNANAFRDMAGLAGTQQLATAGLQTAASLATTFGGSAAALEMAKIAGKQQAVADTDKKLASIKRAKDGNLLSDEQAASHANKVLQDVTTDDVVKAPHEENSVKQMIEQFGDDEASPEKTFEASNSGGSVRLAFGVSNRYADVILATAVLNSTRPTWDEFLAAFPTWDRAESKEVIEMLNKAWLTNPSYENTCTMRLSLAWYNSGRDIPANTAKTVPGVETELSPQTKKRYIVKVGSGRNFLRYWWGAPNVDQPKVAGDDFDPAADARFHGQRGVIVFDMPGGGSTGHIDLWDGAAFSQEPGWKGSGTVVRSSFWKRARGIMLWYLPDAPSPTPTPI